MMSRYQAGTRVSEYVLEACVGAGAFGEVWRARHHVWAGEQVAIKLPTDAQCVRNLQREGALVHGLRHANIVRVIGLDPFADIPYMVMELVRGPSLRQVILENPRGMPVGPAAIVLRGVLRAISAAHASGVLHRDLKPGNVLLDLNNAALDGLTVDAVKVSDFGLGSASAPDAGLMAQSASLARDSAVVGTIAYMAPELRDGKRPADARSDLYSVGVMLFEMLVGERPAGTESPGSLRPEVGRTLDELFSRLYARYERRFGSADEALAVLDRDMAARAVAAYPPPPPLSDAPGSAARAGHRACPSCRALAQADDQFCIACGRQLAERIARCPSCLGYPGPQDRFCMFCGQHLVLGGE